MSTDKFGIYAYPRHDGPPIPSWQPAGSRRASFQPVPSRIPSVQVSDFEIPSLEDRTAVEFGLTGTGLHSTEIRFHCEDPDEPNWHLLFSFQSGDHPGLLRQGPGDLHFWFPEEHREEHILNAETSYYFYFWVDDEMLEQVGDAQILRLVLVRRERERSREVGEFESRENETITLPRIVGQVHFRPPNPIQVEALPTNNPTAESRVLLTTEVVQYRVHVDFPPTLGRMRPHEFRAEFRLPEVAGTLNADVGGFLLTNGLWITPDRVSASGTYDFLASPHIEIAQDRHGRRVRPSEEDWNRFREHGLLFNLETGSEVEVNAYFYVGGGEIPPDYYLAELEEINLSTVPEEGEGAFWLHFNNLSAIVWEEEPPDDDNPFADPRPVRRQRLQSIDTRLPFARSGENEGRVWPHIPLLALPAGTLDGKQALAIAANPHYFHEMSIWEEIEYIFDHTEAVAVIEALARQDAAGLGLAIAEWIVEASRAQNPDLYRSFGVGSFETDSNRGWALRNSPERFAVAGGSAEGSTINQEVTGSDGRNVATVSELSRNHGSSRTYDSIIRVRQIPGVFVSGATIDVLSVRTNRDFDGHIMVRVGIIGHEGGRESASGQGLRLESAAVDTPYSYWAGTIAPRGPFDLSSGETHEIDFDLIDSNNPDRDPEGLWEQLRFTHGSWAGMHVQVALVEIEEIEGKEAHHYADIAYLTVYPYDQLYDLETGSLKDDAEREGDWLILRGTIEPHGYILDEVELEIRLLVQARDVVTISFDDLQRALQVINAYFANFWEGMQLLLQFFASLEQS
jgi:hypothetical protein